LKLAIINVHDVSCFYLVYTLIGFVATMLSADTNSLFFRELVTAACYTNLKQSYCLFDM